MASLALIIFIKNPVLGKVKTRIARTLGDHAALDIYRQLTAITRATVEALPPDVAEYLFYSDFVDTADDWPNERFHKYCQPAGDLGIRMATAFRQVQQTHLHACIIGSDCPSLSPQILMLAFEQLKKYDAVVGPSTDGGYYLLGISRTQPDFLFENMPWSTENVLPETLHRLGNHGWSVFLLPALADIDEASDWMAFQNKSEP